MATLIKKRKRISTRWRRTQRGPIGIDIGSRWMKVAQIQRTGADWKLVAADLIPLEWPEDEPQQLPLGLSKSLRTIMKRNPNLSGVRSNCVLTIDALTQLTRSYPPGTPDELWDMIAQDLVGADTTPNEQLAFDYWQPDIDRSPEKEMKDCDVFTIPSENAKHLTHDLRTAGLRLEVLDALPFTLSRAVQMDRPAEDGVVLALDWGNTTASVTVTSKGIPLFFRRLRDCGFMSAVEAICAELELQPKQTRRLLEHYGLPTTETDARHHPLQKLLAQLLDPALRQIEQEIRRTLTFLQARRPELQIHGCTLFGAGAAIRNVAETLHSRLQLPARVWSFRRMRTECETTLPAPLLGSAIAMSAIGIDQ